MYPELAETYGVAYLESFFEGLPSRDPAALGAFVQADGIHPNAEGVKKIVQGFGPSVLALIQSARD